jgi:TetR/AcrR family transcriptional regulator, transcriptional repressor for nem operon
MRYSAQHKARTHAGLLKKATEQFRSKGLQATGIAKLMGQMGLTHGGFYAHFQNKSELVATATAKMFDETVDQMRLAVEGAPEGKERAAIVSSYLSQQHRDHRDQGCLIPVLTAEISRQRLSVRRAYTQGFNELIKTLAVHMPGKDYEQKCEKARLLISGMAGSMMMAKAVSDRELSDKILAQAREFYISAFEDSSPKSK